jgi:hypothetical protein
VRRLLPWVLLGVLGLGVVVAAVVGAVNAPSGPGEPAAAPASGADAASRWVAGVLATTADAGTAHFDYAHVTTSKNPLLHDVLTGTGVVDFSAGDVQVTEVDRQPSITSATSTAQPVIVQATAEEVGIGRTTYQAVAQEGTPNPVWMKLTAPRDPTAQLGLQTALNASVALSALGGTQRPVSVTDLGHAVVGGVATTKYEVRTAAVCPSPLTRPRDEVQEPTTVWLDSSGRLVQVRAVVRQSGRLTAAVFKATPTLAHLAGGASTTTNTIRFSAFGAPVHILAPTHVVAIPESSTGSASVRLRCSK